MLRSGIRIVNEVNNLDVSVTGIGVSGTVVAIRILIEIFFYYSLIDGGLVISLSFFYESSAFIYFLERLEDCYFILDKIRAILLRLDSFLDNEDSISNLLLLLLLLLYSLSTLVILLIIVIFVVSRLFFFSGKALA